MEKIRWGTLTGLARGVPDRRHLLRGLAAAGLGSGMLQLPASAAAKKKRQNKPRSRKDLCHKNGAACIKPGKACRQEYCLRAPLTIEAVGLENHRHNTILFVPPPTDPVRALPFPYVDYDCRAIFTDCEDAYPFACIADPAMSGDEITTVYRLLPETYEYWIELDKNTAAGAVTIALKDHAGRVVRQWTSPANPSDKETGWHVFDIDGQDGRVAAVDDVFNVKPAVFHRASAKLCSD